MRIHSGELASIPVQECARLDYLNALAPEGATERDVEEDAERRYEEYASARRQATQTGTETW